MLEIQSELDAMHGVNDLSKAVKDCETCARACADRIHRENDAAVATCGTVNSGTAAGSRRQGDRGIGDIFRGVGTCTASLQRSAGGPPSPDSLYCQARRPCCASMGTLRPILCLTHRPAGVCGLFYPFDDTDSTNVRAPTISTRAFVKADFRQTSAFL